MKRREKNENPIPKLYIKYFTGRESDSWINSSGMDPQFVQICQKLYAERTVIAKTKIPRNETSNEEFLIDAFKLNTEFGSAQLDFIKFLIENKNFFHKQVKVSKFIVPYFVRIFMQYTVKFRLFINNIDNLDETHKLDVNLNLNILKLSLEILNPDLSILFNDFISRIPYSKFDTTIFDHPKLQNFNIPIGVLICTKFCIHEDPTIRKSLFRMTVCYFDYLTKHITTLNQNEYNYIISVLEEILISGYGLLQIFQNDMVSHFLHNCLTILLSIEQIPCDIKILNLLCSNILLSFERLIIWDKNKNFYSIFIMNQICTSVFLYPLWCIKKFFTSQTYKHEIDNIKSRFISLEEDNEFDYNFIERDPFLYDENPSLIDLTSNTQINQYVSSSIGLFCNLLNVINKEEFNVLMLNYALSLLNDENKTKEEIIQIIYITGLAFSIADVTITDSLDFTPFFHPTILIIDENGEELELQYLARAELYFLIMKLFKLNNFNVKNLFEKLASIFNDVIICDEIISVLIMLLKENRKKFIECFPMNSFIKKFTYYSNLIYGNSTAQKRFYYFISQLLEDTEIIDQFYGDLIFVDDLFHKLFDSEMNAHTLNLLLNTISYIRSLKTSHLLISLLIKTLSNFKSGNPKWIKVTKQLQLIFDEIIDNKNVDINNLLLNSNHIDKLLEILKDPQKEDIVFSVIHMIGTISTFPEIQKKLISINFYQTNFESYENIKITPDLIRSITYLIFNREILINYDDLPSAHHLITNCEGICAAHYITRKDKFHKILYKYLTNSIKELFENQLSIYHSQFYHFAYQYIIGNNLSSITSSFISILSPMLQWNFPSFIFDELLESQSNEQVQMILTNVVTRESYEFPKAFIFLSKENSGITVTGISTTLLNNRYTITISFCIDSFVHSQQCLFEFYSDNNHRFILKVNNGILQIIINNQIITESKEKILPQKWYYLALSVANKRLILAIGGVKYLEANISLEFPKDQPINTIFGSNLNGMICSIYIFRHNILGQDLLAISCIEARLTLSMNFGDEAQLEFKMIPLEHNDQYLTNMATQSTNNNVIHVKGYICSSAINVFQTLVEQSGLLKLIEHVKNPNSFIFVFDLFKKIIKIQPKFEKKIFTTNSMNFYVNTMRNIDPKAYDKSIIEPMLELFNILQGEQYKSVFLIDFILKLSFWRKVNYELYQCLINNYGYNIITSGIQYVTESLTKEILGLIPNEIKSNRNILWTLFRISFTQTSNENLINDLINFIKVNNDELIIELGFTLFCQPEADIIIELLGKHLNELFYIFFVKTNEPKNFDFCKNDFTCIIFKHVKSKFISLADNYIFHLTILLLCTQFFDDEFLIEFLYDLKSKSNILINNRFCLPWCIFLIFKYPNNVIIYDFLVYIFSSNLNWFNKFLWFFKFASYKFGVNPSKFIRKFFNSVYETISDEINTYKFFQILFDNIFVCVNDIPENLVENVHLITFQELMDAFKHTKMFSFGISTDVVNEFYDISLKVMKLILKTSNIESESSLIIYFVLNLILYNPYNMKIPISVLQHISFNESYMRFIEEFLNKKQMSKSFLLFFPQIRSNKPVEYKYEIQEILKKSIASVENLYKSFQDMLEINSNTDFKC